MSPFSQFENYDYVSPKPLIARIKLELPSYFNTESVDDLLFPLYVEDVVNKFRKSFLKLKTTCINVENYAGRLPEDFNKVREAWSASCYEFVPLSLSTSTPKDLQINECKSCSFDCGENEDSDCIRIELPSTYEDRSSLGDYIVSYEGKALYTYTKQCLLKPLNIHAKNCCSADSCFGDNPNFGFDIRDGKMITTFSQGMVHLLYYAIIKDEDGYPLIPDNFFVKDYILKYVKARIFESLRYTTAPETYNQALGDYQLAQKEADISWAALSSEAKKWSVEKTFRQIASGHRKLNRYKIR